MLKSRAILGGILAVGLWTALWAEEPVVAVVVDTLALSPVEATNVPAQSSGDAASEALAGVRPTARPAHMVRYPVEISTGPALRPMARTAIIPDARWDHRAGSQSWTVAAMSALRSHGTRLENTVPRDISTWCPAYESNPPELRRAFWVGLMSALAKHESTYRPRAVGGGNRWFGLLQIYPDTARRYGCRATTGEALLSPEANLSCAVRILNVTVPRDNAIALSEGRWRGVAADWGPMTDRSKSAEMAAWTRAQDYCQPVLSVAQSPRPQARPPESMTLSTRSESE